MSILIFYFFKIFFITFLLFFKMYCINSKYEKLNEGLVFLSKKLDIFSKIVSYYFSFSYR